VLLDRDAIRRGSGGDGGIRHSRFREAMTISMLSNNRTHAPFGMAGGQAGALGANRVERTDGRVEVLEHIGRAEMQPGDVSVIETPGGGGYGVA
jgi:5-oxoprolinase (ATP-hydrolysing)